jgi:hypothetical protein
MEPDFAGKRLFRIALFTSTAIGFITVGPVYFTIMSLGIVNIERSMILFFIGMAVFFVSLLVYIIWTVDILLVMFFRKHPFIRNRRKLSVTASYACNLFLFILIRLATQYLFLDESTRNAIIQWKIREFGFRSDYFGLVSSRESYVTYLLIFCMVTSINTMVLIILGIMSLAEKKRSIEKENAELRIKNMEAANIRLRQQLQPHFLFNSLNVLKTLIRRHPSEAESYLVNLSDFLRTSITHDRMDTISVRDELNFSMNYLKMQEFRFGDAIRVINGIGDDAIEGRVPVFALQLLLENAIKHNAFTKETPLTIRLTEADRWLCVTNNLRPKTTHEDSNGLGLANLSERYRMISGDDIRIESLTGEFSVRIKILDNGNRDYRG